MRVSPCRPGIAAVPFLALLLSCGDSPTDAGVPDHEASLRAPSAAKEAAKSKPSLHYARIKSDGTLVDGSAVSSSRFGTGIYILSFPPPIDKCAASAGSASFQGFDLSVFRTTAQISIGTALGGGFSESGVIVSFFSTSDGTAVDTSFTLTLVCP